MDIRNRKLKGYFVLSVLIIAFLFIVGVITISTPINTAKDVSTDITPLEWQEVINKPTIEIGKGTQYHSSTQYQSGSSKVSYSLLSSDLTVTETNTTSISITTASNTQYKYAYVDFNTKLNVPAFTEYDVKYKFTFTVKRSSSSGSIRVYSTIYDFGKDYTSDSSEDDKINLEKLDKASTTDVIIGNGALEYAKETIDTNSGSTTTGKHEFNTTLTNYSEEGVDYFHNLGVFIFGNGGSGSGSHSVISTVSVTATITAKEAGEEPPTDVSAEYTGHPLTIADIKDSQKEWYNSDIMTLDYSQNADMINFGDKTVKVTVKNSIFKGDGKAGDSKTVRYIKFTITKKKISATITKSEDGESLVANAKTGEVYSGDTGERAPTFGINYTSTDGKGYDSDTYPTDKAGKYKAVAKITNDCNYQLDDEREEEYTYTFEITKSEVTKPTQPLSNLTYNGQEQEFELLNISDIDKVTITPKTSGLTDLGKGKLKAKDAGKYYVTVSLKDNGKATKWKNTTDDIDSYDIELTIDKATLNASFVTPEGGWTWTSDTAQKVSITDNRKGDGKTDGETFDNLTYKVYVDNNQLSSSNVSADADNAKQTNIALSKLPSKTDKYTLKVELDTNAGDGKNYNPVTITQTFNVTDKEIEVKDENVIWSYYDDNGNKVTLTLEQWSPSTSKTYELTYTGKEYDFSAALDGLNENDEVKIDKYTTQSGKNASDYTTTVTLTSSKGKLTKSTFTLKWKINKAKFDLSEVKWDYDPEKPLEYKEDTFQSITLTNLPDGLTFEYEDNKKMNVNEKYTATIGEITVSDELKDMSLIHLSAPTSP
ncbi:MAG: hypothetical protein K2J13_00775, partial [Clostridia bacterium]|nr:hypothetical protein [Clostridia bacterium]